MRVAIEAARDWDLVRELFREYERAAAAPACFVTFEQELAALPEGYAGVLVAWVEGAAAGCVAWRDLTPGITPGIWEMKRLYVRPAFRGAGLAEELVKEVIARTQGEGRIRLDTLPHMEAAIRLYRRMGFREIGRYNENPVAGALFFEWEWGGAS